jgi:glycosyltransferase involved in cell wall biosynthesis
MTQDGAPVKTNRIAGNNVTHHQRKVCIVTPEFPPEQWGGLARTAQRVAYHASRAGLDVHVARCAVEDVPFIPLDENSHIDRRDGITIHSIRLARETTLSPVRNLWECPHNTTLQMMYQSLDILHEREQFAFFHSFFLYPVGYVTGLISKRFDLPHVATIVGNDVNRYFFSPEKVALCKSALENSDIVVGLSRDLIALANALSPVAGKARTIYNSVELPVTRWQRNCAPHTFVLGFAGIFKYAKGLPYLLKALALARNHADIRLELAGEMRDSEKESFNIILEATGTRDAIKHIGVLSHTSLFDWLMTLDAFVLPSVTEGCPNVLMEAMAAGLPVIATRTGAVEDLIEDGVSGIVAPKADSLALSKAILAVSQNPDMASAMGMNARRRMELFSSDVEFSSWSRVYEEVLGS